MTTASVSREVVELRVDPELRDLLDPLTEEEFEQLEKNILADPERIEIVVWMEKNVILDGHNRYTICRKHKLSYEIRPVSLESMEDAQLWIIRAQRGRRNLTPEQVSYWRGKEYDIEKKREGRPTEKSGENGHLKTPQKVEKKRKGRPKGKKLDQNGLVSTRQKIARRHGVGEQTVERDAKFARAVDVVVKAAGRGAKKTILGRKTKIGRQQVQKLAEIATAQPQAAKNILVQIEAAEKPQDVKQIIQEASRQLPKKLPESGLLFPDAKLEKTINPVQLNGRIGYIVSDPNSKPIFNETNDNVDWALWTWNPVTGCWHGCDYCYARSIANDARMAEAYPHQFEPTFHEARLKAPANTPFPKVINRPQDRNVFVCSMADLFGKWVPNEWITKVFEQVRRYPQWNYLFLTKFPQRLRAICDLLDGFPDNAWVGCTVDGQARVKTAEESFRGLRAKVRWLSVEPMQERLTFDDLSMFDWLVVGGKSASSFNGTAAFQPEWEWVEHLFRQARKAGVKIYFKENLTVKPKEVPWDK